MASCDGGYAITDVKIGDEIAAGISSILKHSFNRIPANEGAMDDWWDCDVVALGAVAVQTAAFVPTGSLASGTRVHFCFFPVSNGKKENSNVRLALMIVCPDCGAAC
jgi:hypothetical protein